MQSELDIEVGAPRTGKLTEAELDASISNVIPLHRGFVAWDCPSGCPPCNKNCNQGDDCPARQPMAAEAATSEGAEPKAAPRPHPLLNPRTGLVIVLCTGMPLLCVIVWALIAWLPAT